MSSLAKVNMLGEFGLLPFRRLIQRKPDNYQQAVQEYAGRLRKIYQLSLKERQELLRARKQAIESETFRLNSSAGELSGISIERSRLPSAKLGDEIVLIRQDAANSGTPLVQGFIVKVNDEQIRIKFQEAIFKAPKGDPPKESIAGIADKEQTTAGPSETNGTDKEASKPEAVEASQKEVENNGTFVDFKIRFNLKHDDKIDLLHDEHLRLIETTLANFEKLKCNQAIQKSLVGFYDERNDTLNDKARVMAFTELVPKLNNQQRAAIEQALMRRLTLIEGPAGTGKTTVAAHIAANVGRQRRGRVLVCSPIKETVDKLTEMISKVGGIQVVKLPETLQVVDSNNDKARGRRRDSYLNSETKKSNQHHLDKLVDDEIYLQAYSRFKDTLGNNHEKVHAHAFRMVSSCSEFRRRELETKVISKANVICCQLNQASSSLLKGAEFDMLIMDDVQVTSELDCLIAMMTKGVKQVTLLSDTRQEIRLARIPRRTQSMCQSSNGVANKRAQVLSANQTSNSLRRKRQDTVRRRARQVSTISDNTTVHSQRTGISRPFSPPNPSLDPGNLFERLVSIGLPTVDMRVQYRCHATISNFFIHHFYAGRLKDDAETNDQMSAEIVTRLMVRDESFSWLPDKKYLTAIYKVPVSLTAQVSESDKEIEQSNVIEAKLKELINRLFSKEGVRKSDYGVGIIYNNQTIANRCKFSHGRVKAGTIEKFIGQEEDFIVLVASEAIESIAPDSIEIGISSAIPCDFRRFDAVLNWALTRARLGLFIVVDESKCSDDNWENNNDDVVQRSQDEDCKSWRELFKYYAANNLIVG